MLVVTGPLLDQLFHIALELAEVFRQRLDLVVFNPRVAVLAHGFNFLCSVVSRLAHLLVFVINPALKLGNSSVVVRDIVATSFGTSKDLQSLVADFGAALVRFILSQVFRSDCIAEVILNADGLGTESQNCDHCTSTVKIKSHF